MRDKCHIVMLVFTPQPRWFRGFYFAKIKSMIRKIIAIISAMFLVFAAIWLFFGASAWAEITQLPRKLYECSSVVVFGLALFVLIMQQDAKGNTTDK